MVQHPELFSQKERVDVSKILFLNSQTLDILLQILVTFLNIKPLHNKVSSGSIYLQQPISLCISIFLQNMQVTSYLHRMVEILGTRVLPHLPMALNQLLVDSEVWFHPSQLLFSFYFKNGRIHFLEYSSYLSSLLLKKFLLDLMLLRWHRWKTIRISNADYLLPWLRL